MRIQQMDQPLSPRTQQDPIIPQTERELLNLILFEVVILRMDFYLSSLTPQDPIIMLMDLNLFILTPQDPIIPQTE